MSFITTILYGAAMFIAGAVFGGWLSLRMVRAERIEAEKGIKSSSTSAVNNTSGPVMPEDDYRAGSVTTTQPAAAVTLHSGACGPFYALRKHRLWDELESMRPEDLPALALKKDLYGDSEEYVIVERVGSFTVKGPPIEIIRPNGGKTIDKLDLSDCATGK